MIRRLRHRGLRRFYEQDDRRELNPGYADKIARIFDEATGPQQLDLPGFRLHPLRGDFADYWLDYHECSDSFIKVRIISARLDRPYWVFAVFAVSAGNYQRVAVPKPQKSWPGNGSARQITAGIPLFCGSSGCGDHNRMTSVVRSSG